MAHSTIEPRRPKGMSGVGASSSSPRRLRDVKSGHNARILGFANPKTRLRSGSQDDSFLTSIRECRESSDTSASSSGGCNSSLRDSNCAFIDESDEVGTGTKVPLVTDFGQVFKNGEKPNSPVVIHLKRNGLDKPLELQRKFIPLVQSAFAVSRKRFIMVQAQAETGKTAGLVFGIASTIPVTESMLRCIVLSTTVGEDFKKYFDIISAMHPIALEMLTRNVDNRFAVRAGPRYPNVLYGHPTNILKWFRSGKAPDLSNVQVLALDNTELMIQENAIDDVCEICTTLRHFSMQKVGYVILSHFLSTESRNMLRMLKNSLMKQQNLFGLREHQTKARAQKVKSYAVMAAKHDWPKILAALHGTLSLPSGIIFRDGSSSAELKHLQSDLHREGMSVNLLNQRNESRQECQAPYSNSTFFLTPSDRVILNIEMPKVCCVLHFDVPAEELSLYGLRLSVLDTDPEEEKTRKGSVNSLASCVSVLFYEKTKGKSVVNLIEEKYDVKMQTIPTDFLPS